MRRASLLLAALTIGLGVLTITPGHASLSGPWSDATADTIDPVVSQNAATRTNQNIPVADIIQWSAQFNGAIDKIIYKVKLNGKVPRPGPDSEPIDAPPGFVGASYRLMFTSSTAQVSQITGRNCAAFNDGHDHTGITGHQNTNYAACTDTREGPYKAPNFKHFIEFGVRQDIGTTSVFENEGGVSWGTFDTYNQALSFHDVESEMPCATAPGYVLGGGSCPWAVQIAVVGGKDEITLTFPYVPTWILGNDNDDNAVYNDELRSYVLASDAASITGIVGTAWVDQVVGSPVPICDPTDTGCSGDGEDPVAETLSYAQNFSDCTPPNNGNQRASCIQEIGGFVYVVDWGPDNAYDMGLFSWPVPGYIAGPSCRYQAAVPFLTSGRMPEGVGFWTNNQRNSGYTGVILPYGVRIHSDEDYPASPDNNPYDNAGAPRPGYINVWNGGTGPSQTINNPVPNTTVANPLINDATCSYTPFVGSKFVEGNGKTATGT